MSIASKLLVKTKKLEDKIRIKHSILKKHKQVSKIALKTKEDSINKSSSSLPVLEAFTTKAKYIERVDYSFPDGKDCGIEMILPAGIIIASEIKSGDEVIIEAGTLVGRSLEVIEIINTTTLRLDDVSTYSEQESDISVRFIIN